MDTRGDAKKGRQEPVEEVETISIKREEPEKIIKIGLKIEADFKKKKRLVNCLQTYADVFAWSYDDMPIIDPTIACHKLVVRKDVRLIK